MKKIVLLSLVAVLCLMVLAFSWMPEYRNLGGEWIRQEDGSLWYLHSEEEFLSDCLSCHPEMGETFFFCLPEDSCRLLIIDGRLELECDESINDPSL